MVLQASHALGLTETSTSLKKPITTTLQVRLVFFFNPVLAGTKVSI
jgi:hypothetical protein